MSEAKNDDSELDVLLCSYKARWFRRCGATTHYNKGFTSKEIASLWIDSLPDLDWRAGFVYRLYGDTQDRMIVSKKGDIART